MIPGLFLEYVFIISFQNRPQRVCFRECFSSMFGIFFEHWVGQGVSPGLFLAFSGAHPETQKNVFWEYFLGFPIFTKCSQPWWLQSWARECFRKVVWRGSCTLTQLGPSIGPSRTMFVQIACFAWKLCDRICMQCNFLEELWGFLCFLLVFEGFLFFRADFFVCKSYNAIVRILRFCIDQTGFQPKNVNLEPVFNVLGFWRKT